MTTVPPCCSFLMPGEKVKELMDPQKERKNHDTKWGDINNGKKSFDSGPSKTRATFSNLQLRVCPCHYQSIMVNPINPRECVSTGAAGAQTHRSLEHHLLHPQILGLLVLLTYMHPLILRPRALFYRAGCTRRSEFLRHALAPKLISYK